MTLLANAQQYHAVGLSVLPARRQEKRPAIPSWKKFQKQLPTINQLAAWFANAQDAICVICGQVSGNLEVLDFDNHGELFDAWLAAIPQEICDKLVVEQTPSGGFHVAYRCPEGISSNRKLAAGLRDGKRMTLIETRGEGGLVLCAPTEGYQLLQGDCAHLGALSGNERITLLDAAWSLNELVEETRFEKQVREDTRFTLRPGDDYNTRGDFPALLQTHGWKYLQTMPDGNQRWRRPGKEGEQTSATLKDGLFYVFSSNAAPFEPAGSYTAFSANALLEHGGDYTKAASELFRQGYGKAAEENPGVDLSGILEQPVKPVVHITDPEMMRPKGNLENIITIPPEPEIILPWRHITNADIETLLEGTFLGELTKIYASVTRPPLPLEAGILKAIVTASCCLTGEASPDELQRRHGGNLGGVQLTGHDRARLKINTGGGQLCNLYAMLVGESSSGKDIGGLIGKFMRMPNPHIYRDESKFPADWNLGTGGSAEGLGHVLQYKPNGLLNISEMSAYLDKKQWQSKSAAFLTEIFNQGYFEQNLSERIRNSSSRKADYCAPNVIANIQPNVFAEKVEMEDVDSGFAGRFIYTKMPTFYGNPANFDSIQIMQRLQIACEPFLRKYGIINLEEGYSDELQGMFIGKCDVRFTPSWRRLCNEYYPRFMVMLSITGDPASQGEEVILTDEIRLKAKTLVLWLFANAEQVLSSIVESVGNSRIVEKQLKRIFNIVRDHDRGGGVLTSEISSKSSGSGTTARQRQELLMELRERQWIQFNEGRYSVLSPPPDLAQLRKKRR